MVTYGIKDNSKNGDILVFLEGIHVGKIVKVNNGFQYRPKKSNKRFWGDIFKTLEECKKSLKDE